MLFYVKKTSLYIFPVSGIKISFYSTLFWLLHFVFSVLVSVQKWECKSCTYLNDLTKDICEMCSKSRNMDTDQSMEVGGPECSTCTLVNPRSAKLCQACGNDLKNSPTYIWVFYQKCFKPRRAHKMRHTSWVIFRLNFEFYLLTANTVFHAYNVYIII